MANFLNFPTNTIYFSLLIISYNYNIITSMLVIYIVVANKLSCCCSENTVYLISLSTSQFDGISI